jgi:hypothetical protein
MGWISDRHMKQGGSIGGRVKGRKYPKDGAPLRKISYVIRPQGSIFEPAWAMFECGHDGPAWGMARGRCSKCKPSPPEP